jgi:serine/threonine-protein kinase
MNPEKYNRVKDLFLQACEQPAEKRVAFVDDNANDEEIRREVQSLLKEYSREKQLMPSEPEAPLGDMSTLLSRANIELPRDPNAPDPAPGREKSPGVLHDKHKQPPTQFMDDSSISPASTSTSGYIDAGRFMAGTMVAGRYRIIELLGRGGMGEVYRADDITLNQSVALKFLPALFGSDQKWLDRFKNEVRLARQVTHPNVCRVFDIGEFQGEQFISMEYVDGEDLASLLRRIGRVPHDKAIQIARQLCAGLAAAHDKGVLHRDLKPANVMIDGRGAVRITDFGLAAPADQMRRDGGAGGGARAGTPAYMSPEQLAGKGVTVRSDVYSLGLLLYEMFTGRRAFKGSNLRDYQKLHTSEDPTPPSEIIDDIDPIVERVILKCLEKDPKLRPASAMAVSAALPGGNPLREILAAGDIPSPEVVAAAGEMQGGLPARRATGFLLVGLLSLILMILLASDASLVPLALDKSPAVLTDKAATLLHEKLGYPDVKDKASGFSFNASYYRFVQDNDKDAERWKKLLPPRPGLVNFWYRESPDYLIPLQADSPVQPNDPPALRPGTVRIVLNSAGNLVALEARPMPADLRPVATLAARQQTETTHTAPMPDWAKPLLEAAALDPASLNPVHPTGIPPVFADERAAWEVTLSNEKMHVEAAAFHGRPVYFAMLGQWRDTAYASTREQRISMANVSDYVRSLMNACLLVAGGYLAWRNYRSGRGDRIGALRMAIAFFGFGFIAWLLRAHHVPDPLQEYSLFQRAMGAIVYRVCTIWIFYLALEPYVRRIWPETIISWSRLLGGKWFDPLVARDVLIGSAIGAFTAVLAALDMLIPRWLGFPAPLPSVGDSNRMLGSLTSYSVLFSGAIQALYGSLILLLLLVLMRIALRRKSLVFPAFILLFVAGTARWPDADYVTYLIQAFIAMFFLTLLIRHGLVALVFCLLVQNFLTEFPISSRFSQWHASIAFVGLTAVVILLAISFYTSLTKRPFGNLRTLET